MRESVRSAALWAGALATAMAAGVVAGGTPAATGAARSVPAAVVAPSSHSPALSGNGGFLAFVSSAGIVGADTNGLDDVYVRNLSTGQTMRASVGAKGGSANGPSSDPFLSAGGRFVVFTSEASNLVAGDTNGVADVFRRDLKLKKTVLVSRKDNDKLGNAPSGPATMSANGRLIAFESMARLTPAATNDDGFPDVYVRKLGEGTTRLISYPDPVEGSDPPVSSSNGWEPWISSDGRYVGFAAGYNYIRHDRWTGERDYPCGGADWFGVCDRPVVLSANGQAMSYQNSIPAGLYGIITYFDGRPEWTFWTDTYEVALSADGDTVAFVTDIPVGPETEPLYVLEHESDDGPELIADGAHDPTLSNNGCRIAYVLDGTVQVRNRCS